MMKKQDVVIIGGGIVGAAISYQLSRYNLDIMLLEKNAFFADETSKVNSGIIHSGFHATPGKNKSKLNATGNQLWREVIFKHLNFPRLPVNSLVLAFNEREMKDVHMLYQRGLTNNVPEHFMQILTKKEVLEKEPNVNPQIVGALLATSSWIIDPVKATLAFIGGAQQNGLITKKNAKVTNITKKNGEFIITINNKETIYAKNIINAAGHYADTIAKNANYDDFQLTTRRGEYRILSKTEKDIVKSICFLVPTVYGKGVLVAPMVDGHILVGPTAEDGVSKEDTNLVTQEKFEDIGKIGKKIIPNLKIERTEMVNAGSRPIDVATNDFIIAYAKNDKHFINAAGMQSPAISAAPTIALEIEKLLQGNGTTLLTKTNFNPYFKVMW